MTKKLFLIAIILLSFVIAYNLYQIKHLAKPNTLKGESLIVPSPKLTPQSTTIHFRAVGDVMMGRSVATKTFKKGDWRWPFQETIPYLPPTDYFVGNLEFPIVENCPFRNDGMIFCAPENAINGLTYAGFDLVSLANNHAQNYGISGLSNTKEILTNNQIASLTEYETSVVTIKNIPIGFIALYDLDQPIDRGILRERIQNIHQKTKVIVALVHWGNEYQTTPSERQKELAQMMVDEGVTIIIGSHPHVLQPIESTKTTLIAYSLGNYIFDQMWSEATRKSIILDLELVFDSETLVDIKQTTHPFTIYDYSQPRLDANQK